MALQDPTDRKLLPWRESIQGFSGTAQRLGQQVTLKTGGLRACMHSGCVLLPKAGELTSEPPGKRLKNPNIRSPSTTPPCHIRSQLADPTGCPEHPIIFLVPHSFLFFSNTILKSFKTCRKVERKVQITPIYPVFTFPSVKFFPMFALSFSPSPSLSLSLPHHPSPPFFSEPF